MNNIKSLLSLSLALVLLTSATGCASLVFRTAGNVRSQAQSVVVIPAGNDQSGLLARLVEADLLQAGLGVKVAFDRDAIPEGALSQILPVVESVAAGIRSSGRVELGQEEFVDLLDVNDINVSAGMVNAFGEYLKSVTENTGASHLLMVSADRSVSTVTAVAINASTTDIQFIYHVKGSNQGIKSLVNRVRNDDVLRVSGAYRCPLGIFCSREYRAMIVARDISQRLLGEQK